MLAAGKTCDYPGCGKNTPYTDWTRCEKHNGKLTADELIERRRSRIGQMYRDLKRCDVDAYERCVASASAIALNHAHRIVGITDSQRTALAADIEAAMVEIALSAKESKL